MSYEKTRASHIGIKVVGPCGRLEEDYRRCVKVSFVNAGGKGTAVEVSEVIRGTVPLESVLMDAQKVDRVIARLARQILEPEDAQNGVVLIGIRRGGEALAKRLAAKIEEISKVKPSLGFLNINLYRDDEVSRSLPESEIEDDLNGKVVVIVDDVLYTGRTVRSALDAVTDLGRPQAIRLAVLIDRGLHELPIRGDYVGRSIPTSRRERVQVHLAEHYAETDRVVLFGDLTTAS